MRRNKELAGRNAARAERGTGFVEPSAGPAPQGPGSAPYMTRHRAFVAHFLPQLLAEFPDGVTWPCVYRFRLGLGLSRPDGVYVGSTGRFCPVKTLRGRRVPVSPSRLTQHARGYALGAMPDGAKSGAVATFYRALWSTDVCSWSLDIVESFDTRKEAYAEETRLWRLYGEVAR